jgi:hypothetical protein
MQRTLLAFIVTMAASFPAHAVAIRVDAGGNGDYLTIQEGLDAASDGDTVLVASATYSGAANTNLDFGGAAIVLIGETVPSLPVIDGTNSARCFHFHSAEDTTAIVQGFVIQNAVADSGAGAFCEGGSSPKFVDCTFFMNHATEAGGGIACRASSPVVIDCHFDGNSSSGGAFPWGGAVAFLGGSHARVEGCDFAANSAAGLGGAVLCADSSPDFYSCDITDNVAISGGGGAYLSVSSASFQSCTFGANQGGAMGGGMYTQSASPFLKSCTFTGNVANGQGAGARFLYSSTPNLWRCTFVNNTTGAKGGAIECALDANATIQNCTLAENAAQQGGAGVCCNSASPTITMSIIAFSQSGSALLCESGTTTSNPNITYCDVYGNAGGDALCGSGSNSISWDPKFCDMAAGNVALCSNSPCVPGQQHNPGRLIGASGPGCGSCNSLVEDRSWGSIKALYR